MCNLKPYVWLLFFSLNLPLLHAQKADALVSNPPVGFIENKGQIIDQHHNLNHNVRFLMPGNGLNTQLRYNGFSYDLVKVTTLPKMSEAGPVVGKEAGEEQTLHFHRLDFDFIGMNPDYTVVTEGQSEEYFNYYTTGTPEEGVVDVRHYQKVTYKGIYPKIDLEFLANEGKVKYNFIVHPGGKLSDIRFAVRGADRLKNLGTAIAMQTSQGEVKEEIPFSFYEMEGSQKEVSVFYVSHSARVFGLQSMDKLPKQARLVIDPNPSILWGTYYGGSGNDDISEIDNDVFQNLYAVGTTGSTNTGNVIATTGAHQSVLSGTSDALLTKFNLNGDRQWATYYGGSLDEIGNGIAVTSNGVVHICGTTEGNVTGISTTGAFQTTNQGLEDGFIAKFNTNGIRTWGTYIGASGDEFLKDIKVDASGNVYAVGSIINYSGVITPLATSGTHQTSLRSINYWDALIVKLNSTGSILLMGTYYGGTGGSGLNDDFGRALDIDGSGNMYIAGSTRSPNSIATTGAYQTTYSGDQDMMIIKLNADGTRNWATYANQGTDDIASDLAIDGTGNIYVSGFFGISPDLEGRLIKFNNSGVFQWNRVYGLTGVEDVVSSVHIGTNNNVIIGGFTESTSGISTPNAHQEVKGSLRDGFVASIRASDGFRLWGSYFGGNGSDNITSVVVSGNVLAIGGSTASTNNIATTSPAGHQTTKGTGSDGFIARFVWCDTIAQPGSISGSVNVCNGGAQTYSILAVPGATSYTWTLPGGWVGTSTTTSISTTVGFNSGNVSVRANNVCGTSSAIQNLAVSVSQVPLTPSSMNGPTTVCAGATGQIYTSTTVSGATSYNWTLPSGATITSGAGTNSITVTMGSSSGNVSVTAQNACGVSTARTLAVSVTTVTVGSISGPLAPCSGSLVTYSISPVPGATSYTWTLPSGWSGGTISNAIGVTVGTSPGTISVVANTACGPSTPATLAVSVGSGPTAPTASSNGPICAGTTLSLSASTISGATYSWTGPNGFTSTLQNPTISNAQTNASGTYNVIAIQGSCSSAVATTSVTVNTLPSTPTAFNNGPLCAGSTLQLSSASVGAGTIVWSGPNGFSSSLQNPQILNATTAASGTYSIFTIASGCSSAVANTVVTINSTPPAPTASSNSPACAGGNLNLTASTVIGASYLWTGPLSFSSTLQNPSISSVAAVEAGTYNVRSIVAGCTSAISSTTVVVNETPFQPGPITGSATICSGASGSYSISTVAGATSYTWTLPSGWTGASTTTSIGATAGTNSGNISVSASNACGSSPARTISIVVNNIPAQPGTISGNPTVCSGGSQTYSVSPVSGATLYSWTLPAGWSGSSTSASINATAGSTSGNVTVSAGNSCGTSTVRTLAVSALSAPAQPSTITGSTTVCSGTAQTYSVTNVSGVTYTWVASGGTVTGSGNSVSVTWTSTGTRTLTVTPDNTCGTGTARTLNVTVNSGTPPAQPSPITGDTASCPGSKNYTVTNDPLVTYSWTVSGGGTISGTGNSIAVNWTTPGIHILSCTPATTCGTGPSRNLTVNVRVTPSQPNAINGNAAVCEGSSQTYSVDPVAGATTYLWNLPFGWSGTSTTNSISTTAGSGTGTITVTASNVCGNSPSRSLAVNGTALPLQPGTITGGTSFCANGSASFSISPVSGATSYTWTLPSGWVGASTGTSLNPTVGTAGGTVSVVSNNSCGSSVPRTLAVTVNAVPAQPGAISGTANVCVGAGQVYSVAPVSGATVYNWTLPSGWSGTSSTNSITATPGGASGTISVTAGNTCGAGAARTLAVTSNSLPGQPSMISGLSTACNGVSTTYSVLSVAGVSYTWTLPSGWTGASTSNSINVTPGSSGGTITVVANNLCGASTARTMTVGSETVPAQPGTITGNSTVCVGGNQMYSVAAVSGATSYNWVLPSGWTGNSTTNSITVTAGSANGTLSVTASNTCGNSPARTLSLSAAAAPVQPGTITGSTNVCSGTAQTYSVPSVAGVTYAWNASGGTVSGSGNSVTVTWTTTGSRTLTVTPSNTCGTGPDRTLTVTVNSGTPPAQPSAISGDTASCPGSKTYSVVNDPLVTYSWTVSGGGAISGSGNSISVNWSMPGIHVLSCTPTTSCGTGPSRNLTVNVRITPAQPNPINGVAAVCQGTAQTYSIDPVAGATTYFWTLPSGWTGTSTTPTINATAGSGSGNVSVVAENVCGASPARSLAVTATAVPTQPSAISGPVGGCNGSVRTFSVSSVSGVTYTWTLPSGWSGASTSNSITLTSGSSGGTLAVVATNSCGNSSPRTLAVVVGSPNVSLSQNGDSLLAVQQTGATYQWLNCGTGLPIAGATGRAFVPSLSGTYAVVVTSNGCADTSTCLPVLITGLEETPAYAAPALYPMPVGDVLYIQNQWEEGSKVWMRVYDQLGHLILHSEQSSETLMQLDLSELRNGAYILELQTGKGTSRHKLSKVK
jgi:hypothetical protein